MEDASRPGGDPADVLRDALRETWKEGRRVGQRESNRLHDAALAALLFIETRLTRDEKRWAKKKLGTDKSRWASRVIGRLKSVLNA